MVKCMKESDWSIVELRIFKPYDKYMVLYFDCIKGEDKRILQPH